MITAASSMLTFPLNDRSVRLMWPGELSSLKAPRLLQVSGNGVEGPFSALSEKWNLSALVKHLALSQFEIFFFWCFCHKGRGRLVLVDESNLKSHAKKERP